MSRWSKWRGPAGSRRAFLGGAAAALTLPLLPSLPGVRAAASTPPRRFLGWFTPNGFVREHWLPPEGPLGADLPRTLRPLADVRDELLLISGVANHPAVREIQGDHARGTGGTLTCQECRHLEDGSLSNGISFDQELARRLGDTPFRSLELGAAPGVQVGTCDSGFSCAYTNHISWDDANTPRPKIIDPDLLFRRLFAGSDSLQSTEEAQRRRARRSSVLDHVLEDATVLRPALSAPDRDKLDEYMTAVRELERKVGPPPEDVEAPEAGLDYPGTVRAMADLMVLALEYDLTRVITFMAENGTSYRYFHDLEVSRGHHDLSHHAGDPDKIADLLRIEEWTTGELAYLVRRLAQARDLDGGSLLRNCLVLMASDVADGDAHTHVDLRLLVAGRAGGGLRTGRHLAFSGQPALADLYLAFAELLGAPLPAFGADGTRPLPLG